MRLPNEGIDMMNPRYFLLAGVVSLSACAAVYTNASDSNHVTFLNSDGESIASLTAKARAYCAQYGKTASFRESDTPLVAIFDCNWPQSSPR
jgi:putative hemolysin